MILPPQRGQTRPRVVCISKINASGLSSAINQWLLYFLNTTKIVQKIETGGTNSTSTPILKLRTNLELVTLVNEARHIEHCASA
jgi:hypothetical protein